MKTKIIPALILVTGLSCGAKDNTDIIVTKHRGALRIQVNIRKDRNTIMDYDQQFHIEGMPQTQQDAFVSHILDSLKQEADRLAGRHKRAPGAKKPF